MITTPPNSIRAVASTVLLVLALGPLAPPLAAEGPTGTLKLTIRDASTGAPVPARVEIRAADGAYAVAEDALRVGGDCDMGDQGSGYVDLASTLAGFSDRVTNFYTQSTQFYSDGTSRIALPAGPATLKVFKGPEYNVSVETLEIPAAATLQHEVALTRWVNMPQTGWYSADDHLHIPRPVAELNPAISKMMQAEDIHVANLLQMGKVKNFTIALQHAHGPESYYQEGNYILASGQENPRTHFLGHTITLGAATTHFNAERYLIYRLVWQETAKQGALNGFAHAWAPNGSVVSPYDGMAVVLPHNLLHFVEVLQFNRSGYEAWYDLLALGFRVTPTAGTDFPCVNQTLPGHERFYTKVAGPLTYPNWLESVRQGRTFVTTGPVIEFRVNGEEIGGEVVLEEASSVQITGRAMFDPEREDLVLLELVQNGSVVDRFSRVEGAATIAFDVRRPVDETSWFALRGYGAKLEENTVATPWQFSSFKPTTNVHSAPIYVTLKNRPGIEKSPRSKQIARTWLARLEDVETVLTEENMAHLGAKLEDPNFDAVPRETLRSNREDLLQEIQVAKDFFKALAQ